MNGEADNYSIDHSNCRGVTRTIGFTQLGALLKSLLIIGSFAGCTRPSQHTSNLRIALPQKMANQKVNSLAENELSHIIINITGGGIANPIVYNWDGCDECAVKPLAPLDFSIEVPTGNGRMIQVLAIYSGSDSDGGGDIYYGDSLADLNAPNESVDIAIKSLFANVTLTEAQVQGRFLTGLNDGPTGTVLVKYVPPGKPPMTLMKSQIAAGWFNFFILKELSFTYEIEETHEVLFDNVNMESPIFNVSSNVARVMVPSHYQSWSTGGEQRNPYNLILGFWGKPSTENVVCYDQKYTGGLKSLYLDSSKTNLLQWGPQMAPAAGIASVLGGVSSLSPNCNSTVQYSSVLSVLPQRFGEGDFHSGAIIGMRFPFAAISWLENGETKERIVRSTVIDSNTKRFEMHLLPGLAKYFDFVHVYKFTGTSDFHFKDDGVPCAAIEEGRVPNFSKYESYGITAEGSFSMSLTEPQAVGISSFAMCLAKGNKLTRLGNLISLREFFDGPTGQRSLATKMALAQNSSGPAVYLPNECLSFSLRFLDDLNNGALLPSGKAVRIKIKDDQSTYYNLYSNGQCSGTPSPDFLVGDNSNEWNSLSILVPAGLTRANVTFTPVFLSSSDANYTIPMLGKMFSKRSATDYRFDVNGPWNIAKDMCYEYNVNINSYGNNISIDPNYLVAVMKMGDVESNRSATIPIYTDAATVGLFAESTCTTALSGNAPYSLLYSTHRKIWIKVKTLEQNASNYWAIMFKYGATDRIIDDAIGSFSVDSALPSDYQIANGFEINQTYNQFGTDSGCAAFVLAPVHRYLDNNNYTHSTYIQLPGPLDVNLTMTSGSGGSPADGKFYSDSLCSTVIPSGTMKLSGGATSYPIFYKLNDWGSVVNDASLAVNSGGINLGTYSNISVHSPSNPIEWHVQFNTWPVDTCETITLQKNNSITDEFLVTAKQSNVTAGTFYSSAADCASYTNGSSTSPVTTVGNWVASGGQYKKDYVMYYKIPSSGPLVFTATSTTANSNNGATMTIANLYDATDTSGCDYRANNPTQYACVCNSVDSIWSLTASKCIDNSGLNCPADKAWTGSSCVPSGVCAGGSAWNLITNQCASVFTFEGNLNGYFYGTVGGRCDTSGIRELYFGANSNTTDTPSCNGQYDQYRWTSYLNGNTDISNLVFGASFTLGIKKQTDSGQTTKTFTKQYFNPSMVSSMDYPLRFEILANSHYIVSGDVFSGTYSQDVAVKNFMPDGSLDTVFATTGSGQLLVDGGANQNEYTVNTHSDVNANIYLVAARTDLTPTYRFMVRKFTASGNPHPSPSYFYDTISGVPKTSILGSTSLYVFGIDPSVNMTDMVAANYNLTTGSVASLPTLTDFIPNTVVDLGNNHLLLAGRRPSNSTFATTILDLSAQTFGAVISYGPGEAYAATVISYNSHTEILIVGANHSNILVSDTKIVKINLAGAVLFTNNFEFTGGGNNDDNRSRAVDVFYNSVTSKIYIVSSVGAHTTKDLGIVGLNIDGSALAGHGNNLGIKRPMVPIAPVSIKPYGNGFMGVGLQFSTALVFRFELW